MAQPVEPRGGGIGGRLLLAMVVLIVLWVVLRVVLGLVFSVVRGALLVGLIAVVAWVVLVGPPGDRD